MKGDPNMTRAQDEANALAMLSEILREELFLQSEEIRLADRPPERLAKLREAHKEWIVWRVRKELEKLRMWRDAERMTAEEERRQASNERERARREAENARREAQSAQREAEEARRVAEEQRRINEEKERERERTLKEERDRAAREQRHKTGGGHSFPWQRRSASGGASANNGYGTDRESGRSFDPPPRSHTTAPFPAGANREWNREATTARSGWDAYQSRWAALNASAAASASASADSKSSPPLRRLRFGDIPWPIFSNGPFTPADITSKTVGAFLLSPFHSVDKTTKERLRAALIQWHPDKFEARWLHLIAETEKPLVSQGVGAVARAINDLLAANR